MQIGNSGNRRVTLFGVPLDMVGESELIEAIREATDLGRNTLITYCNLHGAALYHRDSSLVQLFARADLIYIDGTPLAWWGRLMGLPGSRRVTFLDYADEFFAAANANEWRIFHLGGKPGVAARAAHKLMARYAKVHIACRDGYFDLERDNERVVGEIAEFNPHIVLLGMGMPRQERWMLENAYRFPHTTFIAIGSAFDYIAGAVPMPPRWLGPLGLEWTYRLATEPLRLGYRYLVEPWSLVPHAVKDVLSYRLSI